MIIGGDNWVAYYDCDEKMNKYDYTDDSDFIFYLNGWNLVPGY